MSRLYFLEILTMCSTIRLGPKYRHSSKHSVLSPSKKLSLINPLEAKDHLLAKFMLILAVWFGWSWRQRWYSRTIWWHFDDIKAIYTEGSLFPVFSCLFWGRRILIWKSSVLYLEVSVDNPDNPKKDGLAFWRQLEDFTCQGSSIQWPIKYWFDL